MLQNEVAKQAVKNEIKKSSGKWYEDDINRMLKRLLSLNIIGEEYRVLEETSKYPHAILAGRTWSRIFGGLLAIKSVRLGIAFFYESRYEELKESIEANRLKTDKPIFVVIKSRKLDENRVYPVTVQFPDGKEAVVLAINVFN